MRPMRWWDIPAVMALEAELFGDESWTDTMFWSELAERDTRYYVVVDGDAPGGLAGYAGLCAYAPHEAYIQTLGVAAACQGRGLGRELLHTLIDEADRRGCVRLDLEVRADNQVARGMYAAHGFREIGLRPGYYQPSGTDAVVMRRVAS